MHANRRRSRCRPICLLAVLMTMLLAGADVSAGPFTIVVLPDTQFYSSGDGRLFRQQTEWIARNIESHNIAFVAHVGDVTDAGYDPAQWKRAIDAMETLDGVVPHGVAPGNHDLYANSGEQIPNRAFVEHFGPQVDRFRGKPWYRGASPAGFSSVQRITVDGMTLLFLHLDDSATNEELAWANSAVRANRGTLTVLITHDYLREDGRGTKPYFAHAPTRNSGQQIWEKLVRPNPEIFMVLCGHTHGQHYQISRNDAGLPVHELLADYQMLSNGGNGFLRLMRFDPQNGTIEVQTYSPTLDRDLTWWDWPHGESRFTIRMDFVARRPGYRDPRLADLYRHGRSGRPARPADGSMQDDRPSRPEPPGGLIHLACLWSNALIEREDSLFLPFCYWERAA